MNIIERTTQTAMLWCLLILSVLAGCSDDTVEKNQGWSVPGEELEGLREPVSRPACATQNNVLGSLLQKSWSTHANDDELVVMISADWVPGEDINVSQAPHLQNIKRDVERVGGVLLRQNIDPKRPELAFACFEGGPCPLFLARLTKQQLTQLLQESCELRYVERTALDCVSFPQICRDVDTYKLLMGSVYDGGYDAWTFNVASISLPDKTVWCVDGEGVAADNWGSCWYFASGCSLKGWEVSPYPKDCKALQKLRYER